MPDQPDQPDLTPEHDDVRRLLADARHRGATPPEVVARLDATLADLVAGRGAGSGSNGASDGDEPEIAAPARPSAPVVDLASRRRRRVGAGLLAAAAVVVAGVAIGQGLPVGVGVGGSDGGAADSAASGSAGGDGSESLQDQELGGLSAEGPSDSAGELASPQLKSASPAPGAAPPALTSTATGLADELLALRPGALPRGSARYAAEDAAGSCPLPPTGPGRRLRVEVDGVPGVVVYDRPSGGEQAVAVYVCGVTEPVRTVTLPQP